MIFKDEKHREGYNILTKLDETKEDDFERKSFFYLLSLIAETRKHIGELYDFEKHIINHTGLEKPWKTPSTLAISRLAFNLYDNYIDDNIGVTSADILYLEEFRKYMLEALLIRYQKA